MKETATLETLKRTIPGLQKSDIGSLLNTGTYSYYRLLRGYNTTGVCPFCQVDPTVNDILFKNEYWMIWDNPVGKKEPALERHLVIPFRGSHATDLQVFKTAGVSDAYFQIILWAQENLGVEAGAIIMRFGDPRKNAGSIRHLHGNIKIPTGEMRYTETLAKDASDLETKGAKILLWEKMYQAELNGNKTPGNVLTPEEKAFLEKK